MTKSNHKELDVKDETKLVEVVDTNNRLEVTIAQNSWLGEVLNFLPFGIINKNVTGIGATTLELEAKRDSIIVVPTKALACSKYEKNKTDYFYLGSAITGKIGKISVSQINNYIDKKIHHKFIVVADSFKRLLVAFKRKGIDVYNEYFLMIDEVDIIQSDVTYRPILEDVIDYYLMFNQTKRCLVSATIREFSHPIIQKERMVYIDYPQKQSRVMSLVHTNNISASVVDQIQILLNKDSEKILVAYNYITAIQEVIILLKKKCPNISIGILCSSVSEISAGDYFTSLNNEKLVNRVTFITCAYFVGVDIQENCHVVSISCVKKPFTLLSSHKLTQIRGRCRKGVLSETLIFNTLNEGQKENIIQFKEKLLDKAKDVVTLYSLIDKLSDEENIKSLFEIIKSGIQEKMTGKILGEQAIPLSRKTLDKKFAISYFNIDALIEQKDLKHNIYIDSKEVEKMLIADGVTCHMQQKTHTFDEVQQKISDDVKEKQQEKIREQLNKKKERIDYHIEDFSNKFILDELMGNIDFDLHQSNLLGMYIHDTQQTRADKDFWKSVFAYRKNYPMSYVTQLAINLVFEQKKNVDYIHKAHIFHAMDDTFPFKEMVKREFVIGKFYPPIDIIKKMRNIYSSYPTPISSSIQDKTIMDHFKLFVETSRKKRKINGKSVNGYIVEGYNPKKLPDVIYKMTLSNCSQNIYDLMRFN